MAGKLPNVWLETPKYPCSAEVAAGAHTVLLPQFGAGVNEADLKTVRGFLRNLAAFVIRNVVPSTLGAVVM